MDRCPRCGKRWYARMPDVWGEELERRLVRERAQGIHWTGGCLVTGTCEGCGVALVPEDPPAAPRKRRGGRRGARR